MEKGFRQKLTERQEKIGSLVCVGLDPLPEKIPECILNPHKSLSELISIQMRRIVDATAPYSSMYKLNSAHYEAIGTGGRKVLWDIIDHIHQTYPDIPVFLDCKRGDIGRTQKEYCTAHLYLDGVDGMNFNPYMGKDCMEYLAEKDHPGKAIVGLCYTSNPSARETQDQKMADGLYYWEFIAKTILRWAEELGIVENTGLVMAAAYESPKGSGQIFSSHLSRVREIVGDKLWFLIPGVGTQGGFVEQTIRYSYQGPGTVVINSSSGIIFASMGTDFAEKSGEKAKELRDQINDEIKGYGKFR